MNNKITIVSGEPRSGTSLMMQTMVALGLPVAGDKKPNEDRFKHFKDDKGEWLPEYIEKKEDIERRVKHSDMMNPLGFYETEFVSTGVRGVEAEKYKGKVMKIITSGIPEHISPRGMVGTSKKLINKIILCVRNPKNISVSQKNLINNSLLVAGENDDWVYHNDAPPSPLAYIGRTGSFVLWLEDNLDIIKDILIVEYEDMNSNPKEEINKIIKFLEIKPTEDQLQKAIDNVKPKLNRSQSFEKWPEQFEEDGELAMDIYDAITSLDEEKVTYVSTLLKTRQLKNRLEGSRWVDDNEGQGTWINVDPSLYRSIVVNKNNLQDKLAPNARNNDCTKCRYHELSDKEYLIERPVDLGDLRRKMIDCLRDKDLKTIEQCYHCYTFGSIRDGKQIAPERNNILAIS